MIADIINCLQLVWTDKGLDAEPDDTLKTLLLTNETIKITVNKYCSEDPCEKKRSYSYLWNN